MKPFSAIGAILVSASLVTSPPARAQTKEEKAGARAAADAGGDAFDAGNYAEAADLFERAERLLHAPPHLLYAARAHVKLGHLVEARELYLALTREHLAANAPRAFRDAQQLGEKELATVEPRLPYVSVVVQGGAGASSVRVLRNGEPVPPELLGIPTPVNPGEYRYQAFADGMESTTTTVSFREGVRETVVLTLRQVAGAAKKPAGGSPEGSTRRTTDSATEAPAPADAGPREGGGRPFLIASIAGFAVGAAGSAIGTVFLLQGIDREKAADTRFATVCPNRICDKDTYDTEVQPLDDEATSLRNVAIASYIFGGVGLASGITFLIIDQNRPSSAQTGLRVTPVVGLNYAGLSGRF